MDRPHHTGPRYLLHPLLQPLIQPLYCCRLADLHTIIPDPTQETGKANWHLAAAKLRLHALQEEHLAAASAHLAEAITAAKQVADVMSCRQPVPEGQTMLAFIPWSYRRKRAAKMSLVDDELAIAFEFEVAYAALEDRTMEQMWAYKVARLR